MLTEHTDETQVLVLGTAEWDSPIATNQHYVVRELAERFDIRFVESLGLRRPKVDRRDLGRMAARLRRATGARHAAESRVVPSRATVISPVLVPVHRAPTRQVNQALLRKAVAQWRQGPGPKVLWTFTPVTYGLEAEADFTVYHCVDLLAEFPGLDRTAISRGEASLVDSVDLAIASSEAVEAHLRATGFRDVLLLPNVADTQVFAARSRPAAERRPAAIFAGNLTPYKLDSDLLRKLVTAMQGRGELLLAGPIAAGGGNYGHELATLTARGARYLGVLNLAELSTVAGQCTVGLIPYSVNRYTRGVSPLKAAEYLASGLCVISTELASVASPSANNPHIVVADPDAFVDHVLAMLEPPSDAVIQDRLRRAEQSSWSQRGEELRELVSTRIAAKELR